MTVPGGQSLPPGFGGLTNTPPSDPLLLGLSCVAAFSLLYLLLVFRPRTKGGSTAPPVVTSSPVSKLPVIGTIVEFATSPVKLVQRCYDDYGPVFTVPVSPRQHAAEPMTNDVSPRLRGPMLISSTGSTLFIHVRGINSFRTIRSSSTSA